MSALLAAVAILVLAPSTQAQAQRRAEARFVYSAIAPDKCLLYLKEPKGVGRVCRGVMGYNLVLSEFDDRAALELVRADWRRNAIIPLAAVAPEFSWFAGEVAEWRMGADGPFALILRIGVAQTRERPERAETRLLIIRLKGVRLKGAGEATACLVGVVASRGGANEAARAMADLAVDLPCLR